MEELDPRQQKFKLFYLDPNSETFSNAKQSALKAGFAPEYADNILSLMPKWLSEIIATPRRARMIEKSERNLERALDIPIDDKEIGQRALDATKFVASRLGKDIYSDRVEHTGKDGRELTINVVKYNDDDNKT